MYSELAVVANWDLIQRKRKILVRHMLSEFGIKTVRILVNHPPAGVVEFLKNPANEAIVVAVIEDVGAEEGQRPQFFWRVIYPHALELRRRVDTRAEENVAAPEHLQRL